MNYYTQTSVYTDPKLYQFEVNQIFKKLFFVEIWKKLPNSVKVQTSRPEFHLKVEDERLLIPILDCECFEVLFGFASALLEEKKKQGEIIREKMLLYGFLCRFKPKEKSYGNGPQQGSSNS